MVSDLYASEITEIVNIDSIKLDLIKIDDKLNTTNTKVYTHAQILKFVDSANDLFKSQKGSNSNRNNSASMAVFQKNFFQNLMEMTQ